MSRDKNEKQGWIDTLKSCAHPKVLVMLILGFSAGLPILLIFSTLSVWLSEAGVSRSTVTFFSWAALGYSFKFVWAPLVDLLPLPFLTKALGKRRSWLLVSQGAVITAILWMSMIDPHTSQMNLTLMACAAILLGFSSATQDIVIDAYRIECDRDEMQALLASVYIAGYRIGMLVAGAGSLFLASWIGTDGQAYNYQAWKITYICMSGVMLIGVITTLLCTEPVVEKRASEREYSIADYSRFLLLFALTATGFVLLFFFMGSPAITIKKILSPFITLHLASFLVETARLFLAIGGALGLAHFAVRLDLVSREMVNTTYIQPIKEFFDRYGYTAALLLLALVGCYRISDIVLGVISNVFYLDMGFSKNVIAGITKSFGLAMTITGGFLGGVLTVRFGVHRILMLGAILSALTNLLFIALAHAQGNVSILACVIAADNLSAGLAATAFVAFLSSLTSISFTAVQYAIFSSLMTLVPKLVGGYSGSMVDSIGYGQFFLCTALMGIPVVALVWCAGRLNKKNGTS